MTDQLQPINSVAFTDPHGNLRDEHPVPDRTRRIRLLDPAGAAVIEVFIDPATLLPETINDATGKAIWWARPFDGPGPDLGHPELDAAAAVLRVLQHLEPAAQLRVASWVAGITEDQDRVAVTLELFG